MSLRQSLLKEVHNGLEGKNGSIPFPLAKLEDYLEIAKNTNYLLVGDTGCLAGDTIINIYRGKHKGRNYTIEELYYKYKNIKKKGIQTWKEKLDTKVLCYNYQENIIFYNDLIDIYQSGVKEIFEIKTKSGKNIKSTKDHKFLIDKNNNFKPLFELQVGNFIFSKNKVLPKGRNKRPYRQEIISKMPYYPSARKKLVTENNIIYEYQRIKKTRACYDAYLNNLSLEDFLIQVKENPNHNLVFSDLNMDIHHKNEDITDDSFDNLLLISKKEHAKLHGKNGRSKHFGNRDILEDEIISITFIGQEMTYDISMKSPFNNFIANGIVVHNSGKSSIAQDIILNILDWYYKHKTEDIKLSIIYFGMERKQYMYSAKWVSRLIYQNEGILIPSKKILGRKRFQGEVIKLTAEELKLVEKYSEVFDSWESDDTFICIEGTHNPTGIKIFIDDFAKKHGKIIPRKEGALEKSTYVPNHPNHIVLVVTDYVGVLDAEKDENGQKKLRLDKFSWIMRRARDLYGFSPINIQQLSRQLSSSDRIKLNDVKPKLADIADTSELARDSDVTLAIFEPYRYLPEDTTRDLIGYELMKMRDNRGFKYYRSVHILKNSFDSDGIAVGTAFHPETGILKTIRKKPSEMTQSDYDSILDGSYFLTK